MELLERNEQLTILEAALSEASRGHGAAVLVSGEPGIGKTSLVTTFQEQIADHTRILWGICDDLWIPRPLAPLTDLTGDVSDELREALKERGSAATVPQLMLRELSVSHTTVLVLEDVHWADQATLDLVTVIGRRVASLPAVLILTYREGEVPSGHPLWTSLGSLPSDRSIHVRLEPLSRAAVAAIAGDHAERVYALTGGNPFYVSELLAQNSEELPPSVANAVLGRAARLAESARRLIETVSVVPGQIGVAVLDRVMPEWPEAAEEPERQQLLHIEPRRVRFRHELARVAIRSSIPVTRRRLLHAQILTALVALDAEPAEVVHHAEAAGDLAVVADYALVAARRASAAGSNREALAHYRRAAEFADRIPAAERAKLHEEFASAAYLGDDLDQAFAAIDRAIELFELHGDRVGVGRCLRHKARFSWYAGEGDMARDLARASVDMLQPLGESVELARSFGSMAQLANLASRLEESRFWADRAVLLATETGDDETRVHALVTLGLVRCLADPDDTAALLEAHTEADRLGEKHEAARALLGLADRMFCWVRPQQAWQFNQRARAYARDHEVDTLLAFLNAMAAWHRLRFGDWEEAERLAGLEIATGAGVTHLLAGTVLAELSVRRGHPDARERLTTVSRQARRTREVQWIGPTVELEMEHALLHGEALPVDLIRQAHEVAGQQAWAAEGYGARLVGWAAVGGVQLPFEAPMPEPHAAMAKRDWAAAAHAFGEAGWEYDQALILSLLDDRSALTEALAISRRLEVGPLQSRVVRRLRQLGHRVPRGPQQSTRANPAGLTAREVEVLQLVASGMTNAEIAERLNVSARTAEHHVSALLTKLGVPTRRDAARRAAQLDLLRV